MLAYQFSRRHVETSWKPSPLGTTGVLVAVRFGLKNVSDTTLRISTLDFHLLDENMVSTGVVVLRWPVTVDRSDLATEDLWALTHVGHHLVFQDLEIGPLSETLIMTVFDIPRTGLERTLKLRFRDDSPVELLSSE